MLAQPIPMLIPEVVGFRLTGALPEGATATDLVLTVTQMLRKKGVVGKFVEFFGPGVINLTIEDQATIANMAPEYGATCGFFPVSAATIGYLTATGRDKARVALVEAYAKAQGLWIDETSEDPVFTDVLELDMAEVVPGLFGISKDLAQTAQADNPLSRRLGLRDALDSLEALHKRLPFLGREARERWAPVLNRWNSVIMQELETLQAVGVSGGVENPYEVGNPVQLARQTLFKGRAELRDAIVNALRERGKVTLVLSGPRRMGKTSFLLQLPALLPGKTIPAFVDLQRPAVTASDSALLFALAQAISRDTQPYRIILPPPIREKFNTSPFEAFDDWLDKSVYPSLQDFTILLTFDEFEKAGEALSAGRLSRQVLDELRHTIQHRERLALLFAGVQALDELGPEWSSYFINVRSLTLGFVDASLWYHALFLVVMGSVGFLIASRRLGKLLLP